LVFSFFFFFVVVLGIELKASHWLGRCLTTLARPSVFLLLVCFSNRVSGLSRQTSDLPSRWDYIPLLFNSSPRTVCDKVHPFQGLNDKEGFLR
jgi:hypothetical protein